jgi:serine/threonine-protein kinase RsbW
VINAIKHGNCNEVTKRVYLEFILLSGKEVGVHIRVRDEGCGFDPASLSDPLKSENIFKPSSRGIFLIRSLMDELAFEKTARGGTEVVMVKRSARVDRPEPQTSG